MTDMRTANATALYIIAGTNARCRTASNNLSASAQLYADIKKVATQSCFSQTLLFVQSVVGPIDSLAGTIFSDT